MAKPAMQSSGQEAETAWPRADLADVQADLQRHVESLSRLQAELMGVRQELSAFRAESVHLHGVVVRAGEAISAAQVKNAVLQNEIIGLRDGIAALEAENVRLHVEGEAALDAVHASLSWRISAPVRAIGRLLGRP